MESHKSHTAYMESKIHLFPCHVYIITFKVIFSLFLINNIKTPKYNLYVVYIASVKSDLNMFIYLNVDMIFVLVF